jgi:hypothetical protein
MDRTPIAAAAALLPLALAVAVAPAFAGTQAVSEKAFEDTGIGFSIKPMRGWEPTPRKSLDDPLAPNDAGGWYCKDKDWSDAKCMVLRFGSFFGDETRAVATEAGAKDPGTPDGKPGGDGEPGKDGGGEGGGGEGEPKGDGPAPKEPPRTLKELIGKGPQSFEEWIALVEKSNRGRISLDLSATKAKFGDDDGQLWEGRLVDAGGGRSIVYGASIRRGAFEVAVLYVAADNKNFVRDMKGPLKASVKSLRILDERKMLKAKEALEKKVSGADPEAAYAERAIAGLPKGWLHKRTDHYVIVYDKTVEFTTPGLVNRIANQLERIRAQVYEPLFPAARPITALSIVKVTQDYEQYRQYDAPEGSAGYWSWPSRELVFFCNPTDFNVTLDVLNHEAFHQYIFYAVGQVSPHSWFNEGHGDFFAGYDLKEGKFLQRKFHWRQDRIKGAIENRTHVPLEKFLRFSQAEYYRRGGNKSAGEDIGQNYAQGWSLVWFLRTTSDSRYAGILDRYFGKLKEEVAAWRAAEEAEAAKANRPVAELIPPDVNQKAIDAAYEAGFQGVDLQQLEKDWIDSKPY